MDIKNKVISLFQDYIQQKKITEDHLLSSITVLFFRESSSDLYNLYRSMPPEYFENVIKQNNGKLIRVPSWEEYRYWTIMSFIYYLHEVQGHNWKEIKTIIDIKKEDPIFNIKEVRKILKEMKEKLTK